MSSISGCNNIVNSVMNREYGLIRDERFRENTTSSKMQDLRCSRSKLMQYGTVIRGTNCRLLKTSSGGDSALGVWRKRQDIYYSIKTFDSILKINFSSNSFPKSESFVPCINIERPFQTKMELLDFIEMECLHGHKGLLCCGKDSLGGIVTWTQLVDNETRRPDKIWRVDNKLLCVAEDEFTGYFAVGAPTGIHIFNEYDWEYFLYLEDSVTSLAFYERGNVLFVGRDSHSVSGVDLRCTIEYNNAFDLGHRNAKAIKVLSDQRYLIVSSEKISKIDLRMNSTVCDYSHHIDANETRKSISVDEELDMLCATGEDNHTRIWSLSSGKLIKTFAPYLASVVPAHSCLQSAPGGFSVTIIENGWISVHYVSDS